MPIGWLYITYHLLSEPETAIDQMFKACILKDVPVTGFRMDQWLNGSMGWFHPKWIPHLYIGEITNPLILTIDPNFQRDIHQNFLEENDLSKKSNPVCFNFAGGYIP